MDFQIKRELNNNYLILNIKEKIKTDEYMLKTFSSNPIPGFLPCSFTYFDDCTRIKYDITSKQTLYSFCESAELRIDMLKSIYCKIFDSLTSLQDYLIDTDYVLLDAEHIYINFNPLNIYLIFAPTDPNDIRNQFKAFTEYILSRIDHNDKEAVMLGYKLYRKILDENYLLKDLYSLLYSEPANESLSPQKKPLPEAHLNSANYASDELQKDLDDFFRSGFEDDKKVKSEGLSLKSRIPALLKFTLIALAIIIAAFVVIHFNIWKYLDFYSVVGLAILISAIVVLIVLRSNTKKYPEDDFFISDDFLPNEKYPAQDSSLIDINKITPDPEFTTINSEYRTFNPSFAESYGAKQTNSEYEAVTELLSSPTANCSVYLEPLKKTSHSAIVLNGKNIIIGKNKELADFVISDSVISRLHAKLYFDNGNYYVQDLNSKNGTFLNNKKLDPTCKTMLSEGDLLSFANAEFIFHRK